jgi:prepilin-type processing-associated H-X9-DG protein
MADRAGNTQLSRRPPASAGEQPAPRPHDRSAHRLGDQHPALSRATSGFPAVRSDADLVEHHVGQRDCTNGDDEGGPATQSYTYYVTQGTGEAYSFHPGGANFVFGDGAVHFLNENISIHDFARLVTRDQQDVMQVP